MDDLKLVVTLLPIERYLTLRRRLAQASLYVGLMLLFGVLILLLWLEASSTLVGSALVVALLSEIIVYAELHKRLFHGRYAPRCPRCGGSMIVEERDKDNPVGSARYYAEIDETDEVFACRDCDTTWRNLSRR